MQKEEEEEKGEIGRKVALAVSQARELGTGERGSERGRAAKVSLDRPSDPPSLPFSPPLRIHFFGQRKKKRRGEPASCCCVWCTYIWQWSRSRWSREKRIERGKKGKGVSG